jgi:hypothetical protein
VLSKVCFSQMISQIKRFNQRDRFRLYSGTFGRRRHITAIHPFHFSPRARLREIKMRSIRKLHAFVSFTSLRIQCISGDVQSMITKVRDLPNCHVVVTHFGDDQVLCTPCYLFNMQPLQRKRRSLAKHSCRAVHVV